MRITPMTAEIGADITDVQLALLGDAGVLELKHALAHHGVLHIRDQILTPEQHIAFAKAWGEIDVNPFFPSNTL